MEIAWLLPLNVLRSIFFLISSYFFFSLLCLCLLIYFFFIFMYRHCWNSVVTCTLDRSTQFTHFTLEFGNFSDPTYVTFLTYDFSPIWEIFFCFFCLIKFLITIRLNKEIIFDVNNFNYLLLFFLRNRGIMEHVKILVKKKVSEFGFN